MKRFIRLFVICAVVMAFSIPVNVNSGEVTSGKSLTPEEVTYLLSKVKDGSEKEKFERDLQAALADEGTAVSIGQIGGVEEGEQ